MAFFKKYRASTALEKFLERGSEERFENFIIAVERLNEANKKEMLDGMLSETDRFASILLGNYYALNLKIRFLNLLSCLSLESQEKIISKRFHNGIIYCSDGSCGPNDNYDVLLGVAINTNLGLRSKILKPLLTIISEFSEEVRSEILLNSAICSEQFLFCHHSRRLIKPSRDGRISNTLDWIRDQYPEISECTTSSSSESQAAQQQESTLKKDKQQVFSSEAHEQSSQVNEGPSSLRFFDSRSMPNHATRNALVDSGETLKDSFSTALGVMF